MKSEHISKSKLSGLAYEQSCLSFTILWTILLITMSFITLNCDLLSFIIALKRS